MAALPSLILEPLVRQALLEDWGHRGDLTSDSIIPADRQTTAVIRSRQEGVLSGLQPALLAFSLTHNDLAVQSLKKDGAVLQEGDDILTITGPAAPLLAAERTALNFLCHLSGIATATAGMVSQIDDLETQLCCTRKTTPGLRSLEKQAVIAGGGVNHRFGLDDAILIKDNHIAVAGSLTDAVTRAKAQAGHMVQIEVEVDTIEQLQDALRLPVDAVLLDNMDIETLQEAVTLVDGQVICEASGTITTRNIRPVAETGVNLISSGWITHSAPALDLGLDIDL